MEQNNNNRGTFIEKLPRSFFERPAEEVARGLLGMQLHRGEAIGRVVETEAYVGEHDLAAHSSKGRTARTETLFGEAGHAYVYFIYGMYWMLNVVTGVRDRGEGVLIRAIEPIAGIVGPTEGPGKLTRTLGITGADNGVDIVLSESLYFSRPNDFVSPEVIATKRVGVDYAAAWADEPLRFYIADNRYVSRRVPSRANKNRTS